MSETVLIFGAGVSKSAGAPMMEEFLDAADYLRKTSYSQDKDFELVFKGRDELQLVHSKSTMNLLNLESVFGAFEMAKLLNRLGSLSNEEIDALPGALGRVIQHTLEKTVGFPFHGGQIHVPAPYDELGNIFANLRSEHYLKLSRISLLTFNYDLCLDYMLHHNAIQADYCLGSFKGSGVKLLKLHGSLNWSRCAKCGNVVPLSFADFFNKRHFNSPTQVDIHFNISAQLKLLSCCGSSLSGEPFIAPPTWNKTEYHGQLLRVWREAAKELSDAENIIVCGYSLPETDQFFRYLYALGSVGKSGLKKFWVINPDASTEIRFKSLCGQLALSRFQFHPLEFRNAIWLFDSVLRGNF